MSPQESLASPGASDRVLRGVRGGIGEIVLNRPEALNALDRDMFVSIHDTLAAWREDARVTLVLVRGNGSAFSAGGDIRAVRSAAAAGDRAYYDSLYRAEYGTNALISAYPKPYVALVDGYAMGGGLGLVMHGAYRVVTERAQIAMPETAIGFFPDVGASYVFPRLPGALGMYLGLTGERLDDGGALTATLATHAMLHDALGAFADALRAEPAQLEALLERFAHAPAHDNLAELLPAIDRCFGAGSLAGILGRLRAEGTPWARRILTVLGERSPTALAVTFALFRRGAAMSLQQCLDTELRLGRRMLALPDFAEGVRAQVIDKDRTPRWSPARLDEVDVAAITRMVDEAVAA